MAQIFLRNTKSRRIALGHPWIYDNEIAETKGDVQAGDIVEVYDYRRKFVGKGYINPKSQIRVRLLTRNLRDNIDKAFFRRRIEAAYEYRRLHGFEASYRLVFGEADFLPALVIDKFGDYFVIQTLALGIDRFKDIIAEVLTEMFQPRGIYERNDVPVRELEGLPQQTGCLGAPFTLPEGGVRITENGFHFAVDIANGQKTGYFLDQTANRAAIAPYVAGKQVLDCFCHTGSFAVHAAGYGAERVTAVDISEHAIASATANARLNGLESRIEFVCANAFDKLKTWTQEHRLFDTVILDPPAFTKSRGNLDNALRGYKEINLRGMKLVKPGGFLITCTCSHFVKPEHFRQMLHDAAADAGKIVREVSFSLQGKDHPVLWNVDETIYLKMYILQLW